MSCQMDLAMLTDSAGKRGRTPSPSASPDAASRKVARGEDGLATGTFASEEAQQAQQQQSDDTPQDHEEQQQQEDDGTQDQEWTTVTRGRHARHQQLPRPKFKLGSHGDHGSAYQAITALEREHPELKMEVRPNLQGEYILTPKSDDSATLLRSIAEEGNRVLLLDPSKRVCKVLLERYPLNLPLDAVEAHPRVTSAQRLRAWRDKAPTRQVLLVLEGPPPAKLDLGCWGKYSLRPYQGEPVRCYKCQRFSHLQARCPHTVRCGVCSLPHPTEDCITRHKAHEATTAKCPNCRKSHHAWNPQCPERLRRLPRPRRQQERPPTSAGQRRPRSQDQRQPTRQQQHQQQVPQRQPQQQQAAWRQQQHQQQVPRGHRQQQQQQQRQRQTFVPAPPPVRSAWSQARTSPAPAPPSQQAPRQEERDPRTAPRDHHTRHQREGRISGPAPRDHTQVTRGEHTQARSEEEQVCLTAMETDARPPPDLPSTHQGGARPRQSLGAAAPGTDDTSPPQMRRAMAPSDPLHGVPVTLSEETRVVVNCILARMMQLLEKLLDRPDRASTRLQDLDALLRRETASAIMDSGLQPPNPRDPRLRALYPAAAHHQDGEQTR